MKTSTRIASARIGIAAGIAAAAIALFAAPASASNAPDHGHSPQPAVFVQSDNVDGNTVVAYNRGADGTLTQAGVYPTGGLGGVLDGSVVDHLASQGSLTLAGNELYAVNAGSNTLTVFEVVGSHLAKRQTISSGGTFPVSVAVSGRLVFVLNARDGGSIQGFRWVDHTLVKVPAWSRNLELAAAAPEFTHTPGQIAFTPDGSAVVVTTKAGGQSVLVYPIGRAGLAVKPVVNDLPGAVPFAVTFDQRGRLVLAEAGTNSVATFDLARNGTLSPADIAATGQAATCWIVRNGKFVYASNAGSGSVSRFQVGRGGKLTAFGTTATDGGTVDAAATGDGRFLYVQTGAAGIVDEFRMNGDGSLTSIGSVTVPGAVGGEGIAAA